MPLKWTPTSCDFDPSCEKGNRILRRCPLFFDGDQLHVLVPYHEKDSRSSLRRIVLESYAIVGTELRLQHELELKSLGGEYTFYPGNVLKAAD